MSTYTHTARTAQIKSKTHANDDALYECVSVCGVCTLMISISNLHVSTFIRNYQLLVDTFASVNVLRFLDG